MEQIYDEIIKKAKINTIESVRACQKGLIPFVVNAQLLNCDRYRYKGRWYSYTYSDENRDVTYGIISIDSASMPYKNMKHLRSDQSFISRLDALVTNNILDPILLFINGRFVKWENIDVIYDCGNTWFKVYGEQYNYYDIKHIDMMIIPFHVSYISIESDYQFDKYFEYICAFINESAKVRLVNGVKRLVINIPRISDVYVTDDGEEIQVGVWYYNQLRAYYIELLSEDRQEKLRRINITKTNYNPDGTIDRVYSTPVNLLDEDSMIKAQLDFVKNINAETIINNTIFRFDDNGLLDYSDDSTTIITNLNDYDYRVIYDDGLYGNANPVSSTNNIVNINGYSHRINSRVKDLVFERTTYNLKPNQSTALNYDYMNINNILFRENFIVFRDGMMCNGFDNIGVGEYNGQGYNTLYIHTNSFKVHNTFNTIDYTNGDDKVLIRNGYYQVDGDSIEPDPEQEYKLDVLVFYDRSLHRIDNLSYLLPLRSYMVSNGDLVSYFNYGNKAYIRDLIKSLSFEYSNSNTIGVNQDLAFNKVTQHNMLAFNPLYEKLNNYQSITMVGSHANENFVKEGFFSVDKDDWGWDNLYTFTIQRMQHVNYTSYCMVYVNGELIDHYNKAKLFYDRICIPMEHEFNEFDEIELFYLNHCNNNELKFTIEEENGVINRYCPSLPNKFNREELNVFSGDYQLDKDLLVYKDMEYDEDIVSFALKFTLDEEYNITLDVPDESFFYNKQIIMTSENRFSYQRFDNEDQVRYMFKLGKQFKYCDNQMQYMVFINGRKLNHHDYLVTIPKLSRPFNYRYIYLMKFAQPGDRVEIFYTPIKCNDFAHDNDLQIPKDGYINLDDNLIYYPFIPDTYYVSINGKKVSASNMRQMTLKMCKLLKDYRSYDNFSIIPLIEHHPYDDLNVFLHNENKLSDWDKGIYNIYSNGTGVSLLNTYFMDHISQSPATATEDNAVEVDVSRIAIINEIIRDFWVSNGFEYHEDKFLYDYYIDNEYSDAIYYDEASQAYILPAMDASIQQFDTQENKDVFLNIDKDTTAYHLFFSLIHPDAHKERKLLMEIGTQLSSFTLHWAYNDYYKHSRLVYQKIYSLTNNNNFYATAGTIIPFEPVSINNPIAGSDNINSKYYTNTIGDGTSIIIDSNNPDERYYKFKIKTSDGTEVYNSYFELGFTYGVYYGLIDEDLLDERDNVSGEEPDIDNDEIMRRLTRVLNEDGELLLEDYTMDNNKYFIYAAPKSYLYNEEGEMKLNFYLPDLNSFTDDDLMPGTVFTNVPLLTNGKYITKDGEVLPIPSTDVITGDDGYTTKYHNNMIKLNKYTISELDRFNYTNSSGYNEEYVIMKTNGYFTHLKYDTKVRISVKSNGK